MRAALRVTLLANLAEGRNVWNRRAANGRDCFLCRMMRSFAFTGLGAAAAGFGALALGLAEREAVNWALAGGLLTGFLAAYRRR
jgi:hypothetical protein